MPRRTPYTKVEKYNQVREPHVRGMGDKLYIGFQCMNSQCKKYLFVLKEDVHDDFEIICTDCGYAHKSGEETNFYSYELMNTKFDKVIESGEFAILHDDYIEEAQEYKYCIICNTIKPAHLFDKHSSRNSGRQGECRLCKGVYNSIKNQTRISDQHREAAQKRRMYLDLAGGMKIDSKEVFRRFSNKCFKCGTDLKAKKGANLDHTLPVFYLWPLTTDNATLLCREHNSEKSGKWPSEYYNKADQKKLAVITGIDYALISGPGTYNPEAIDKLHDAEIVDTMLIKYAAYLDELIKLRNRLINDIGFDFFDHSKSISKAWKIKADQEFKRLYG